MPYLSVILKQTLKELYLEIPLVTVPSFALYEMGHPTDDPVQTARLRTPAIIASRVVASFKEEAVSNDKSDRSLTSFIQQSFMVNT